MAFNFPNAPVTNQIYTAHGASYRWADYAWLPTGAAGGVGEAPNDGQQYARQSLTWTVVSSMPAVIDGGVF